MSNQMLFNIYGWADIGYAKPILAKHHYLKSTSRGTAWMHELGCIVISSPTSRMLPATWLELSRWCIVSREKNAGSKMWREFVRDVKSRFPECTTIVSYSDPSVGHDGALYRACNWLWAPTWHRLRPPPSQNGKWKTDKTQSVKDRWVFLLRPDHERVQILDAGDESILRKMPWARYAEPKGADFKMWKLQKENKR